MNVSYIAPIDIKAFVPAKDFQRSLQFYEALGFTREFAAGDLAGLLRAVRIGLGGTTQALSTTDTRRT